jgi:hypothetical protein
MTTPQQQVEADIVAFRQTSTAMAMATAAAVAWQVPNTPMHFVLQCETVLSGVKPPAALAGHIDLDWFAYYASTE